MARSAGDKVINYPLDESSFSLPEVETSQVMLSAASKSRIYSTSIQQNKRLTHPGVTRQPSVPQVKSKDSDRRSHSHHNYIQEGWRRSRQCVWLSPGIILLEILHAQLQAGVIMGVRVET
ncbi:hypothetical protein Bbelb_344710 [Branchiostoma belcheri]|nr:hypothetical protein Bbelb_344710 [Branchiostoma belcheri]